MPRLLIQLPAETASAIHSKFYPFECQRTGNLGMFPEKILTLVATVIAMYLPLFNLVKVLSPKK